MLGKSFAGSLRGKEDLVWLERKAPFHAFWTVLRL